MSTIGLRDLYVAEMKEDETYDAPERLAKAIKSDLSVKTADSPLYADDSVDELASEFTDGSLKLSANDIPIAKQAKLLGQKIGANGVLFAGENDKAPYFAIGFRAMKPSGKYRYVWLFKAKFKIWSESYETKSGGISYKTPELEAQFIKRDKDGFWKADYVGAEENDVAKNWFKKVVEPEFTDSEEPTDPNEGGGEEDDES